VVVAVEEATHIIVVAVRVALIQGVEVLVVVMPEVEQLVELEEEQGSTGQEHREVVQERLLQETLMLLGVEMELEMVHLVKFIF
jgi:hypothetical protein